MWFITCAEIKCMTTIAQNVGRSKIEVYCSKVLTWAVVHYLKVDCAKLKTYTLNPKETTKGDKTEL